MNFWTFFEKYGILLKDSIPKKKIITHILVTPKDVKGYFEEESLLLVEQITVVAKKKIISKVGHIPETSEVMKKVNDAIIKQLGVDM